MSKMGVLKAKCPKCGKEFEVNGWDSINANLDPELKKQLLDGEVFHFTCPECSETFGMMYPILYNDMTHKCMVQFCAQEEIEMRIQVLKASMDAMNQNLNLREPLTGIQYRFVTNFNDMREKIYILDAGLDDRVIELLKVVVANQLGMLDDDHQFLFTSQDGANAFVVFTKGEVEGGTEIPDEAYQETMNVFKDALGSMEDYVVDREWALKKFGEKQS